MVVAGCQSTGDGSSASSSVDDAGKANAEACNVSHTYWEDLPSIVSDYANSVETAATTSRKLINMRHDILSNDITATGVTLTDLSLLATGVGQAGVGISNGDDSTLATVADEYKTALAQCQAEGASF